MKIGPLTINRWKSGETKYLYIKLVWPIKWSYWSTVTKKVTVKLEDSVK